ncbi:lipoprotein-releasing system permease protein [Tistlia consotensis]|uniref:Lipoprotein-releasing system permease protein n=1 Tax=Tistlia consotensis USBA 355 TaxID=560819 RepID=A0A1Y6CK37_9PROT|nr:lipoprotein-releasing ABC transporter permease subunit [Tistlia consotensis]SMF70612.1 lipoprotein-releasing system permease protein [Tistlia consotensis USBA 355]SNS04373.1 lipoprotein-releasing system permease protein [Tistlia consotensis]
MVFGAFERMMALRYVRSRRQESFISVIAGFSLLGIALGVATLIIVMAVMNGFRQELLSRILGVNGHLTVYGSTEGIDHFQDLAAQLRKIAGVDLVVPQIQEQVIVTAGNTARGAMVRGLDPAELLKRKLIADNIVQGSAERFRQGEGVLVGRRLGEALGRYPGDQITLLSPQGNTTAIGTLPRVKSYPIAGYFEIGMYEYDSSFVYMPLDQAQLFFRLPDKVNAIELFLDNPDHARAVAQQVAQFIPQTYRIVDWQRANSSFFNAIQVERNVMFLILSLIILVAAFNILSGQYMLVKGKGRDIAILRTMGARRGMILRIFFMSGASIGLVGTLAGVVLGILFTDHIVTIQHWVEALAGTRVFDPEIYFLTNLPAQRDPVEVVQVVLMALAISFLAPLLPAWQAARLDPVEALRYE